MKCPKCGTLLRGKECPSCTRPRLAKFGFSSPSETANLKSETTDLSKEKRVYMQVSVKKTEAKDHYILCPPFTPKKLEKDRDFIIGREEGNQIIFPSYDVSRFHAKIYWEKNNYVIEDLNSSNGTFINGNEIQRHILSDDDVISISSVSANMLAYREVPAGEEPELGEVFAGSTMKVTGNDLKERAKSISQKERTTLQGEIDARGLFAVLQMLGMEKRPGCLKLMKRERLGFMYIDGGGNIIHSSCGETVGIEAFFEIMKWSEGSFKFHPEEAPKTTSMHKPIEWLLLEIARKMDEEGQ